MPVVSSIVAEDGGLQADGRKFIRFEFTTGTGEVLTHFGYRKYPGGTDAEAQRVALIPDVDASLIEQEKQAIWGAGLNGEDISAFPAVESPIADLLTYWWRRFMNVYSDEGTATTEVQIEYSISAQAYYNLPSSPQIAGYIDDPAWTTQAVNNALNGIQAIAVNVPNLEHSNPVLDL